MLGIKISTAKFFAIAAFAASSLASAAEWFPLEVGNSWVYRVTQGRMSRPGTIEVLGKETVNGQQYFRVKFFENENLYLRQLTDGAVMAWDAELNRERVWLPAGAPEGQAVETAMDPCSKMAKVQSRSARVKTEMGDFNNALQLVYTANCADAGVTVQYFLPYVGLISHETSSIAGPVRHELVYSRTGLTSIDTRTNAFALALDAPVYKAGSDAKLLARVMLRVSEPIVLTFPSSQNSDMRILDEKGATVYTWSADKLFAMVFREERVQAGERNFAMEAPLGQLPPGKYTAEAWLTTQPRLYSASVSFEIVR